MEITSPEDPCDAAILTWSCRGLVLEFSSNSRSLTWGPAVVAGGCSSTAELTSLNCTVASGNLTAEVQGGFPGPHSSAGLKDINGRVHQGSDAEGDTCQRPRVRVLFAPKQNGGRNCRALKMAAARRKLHWQF